jgi:hypothetical protein
MYLQQAAQNSANQSLTCLTNDSSALSSLDSASFSQAGLNLLNSSTQNSTNPLDSLVSNGTITQTQADTVNTAFQAALQFNSSGTYGSTPFNPISSFVNNGTITQAQATAITNAYVSTFKSTGSMSQTSGTADSILGDTSVLGTDNALANNEDDILLEDLENNSTSSTNTNNYMNTAYDMLLGTSNSSNS